MRLRALDLVRYGKFTGRRLDFGEQAAGTPDLHIVYGPNEAGKSTLFSGFLDLLFGIEHSSPYGFLHPYPTMRVGGTIEAAGRSYSAFRVKRKTNSLLGADDQSLPDNLFSGMLGAIDRDTYQMMFSLDDDSIEKGGEAILKSEGELGSLLFSASSGLPDSAAILAALRGQADAFYRPQARKHQLAELKAELDGLRSRRNALDINAREYAVLRRTLTQARERHEAAVTRRAETRNDRDRLKAEIDALPYHARLRGFRADLVSAPALPSPPAEWADELPTLRRKEAEIDVRLHQLANELQHRCDALEALQEDKAARCLSERLAAIQGAALEARYVTAARDMPARVEELVKVTVEISACLLRLGEAPDRDPAELLLPAGASAQLQELARRHSALVERVASARQEASDAEEAVCAAERDLAELQGEACVGDPSMLAERLPLWRRSNCLQRQQAASQSMARLEADLADKHILLRPFSGDADDLFALGVPVAGTLESWSLSTAAREERRLRLVDRVADEQELLAVDEARLIGLSAAVGALDDISWRTLRQQRDDAWQRHRSALSEATAAAFESLLGADDDATALRLVEAVRFADIQGLSLSLTERRARLGSLRDQQKHLRDDAERQAQDLAMAVTACGLPEDMSLPQLEAWLSVRSAALDLRAQLRVARLEFEQACAEEKEIVQALLAELAAVGVVDALPQRLDGLLIVAEQALSRAQAMAAARSVVHDVAKRASTVLEGRSRALAVAEGELADWREQWHELHTHRPFGGRDTPLLPEEVGPTLAILQELDKLSQRKSDLDYRIAGMRRDQASFQRAIAELSGPSPDDQPLVIFASLKARVDAAQRVADRREGLLSETARLEEELQKVRAERDLLAVRRRMVLEFFDCETLDAALQHFEAAREQQRLRQRIADTEADLASRLGVVTVEEAEHLLSVLDDTSARLELARLDAALDDCDRDVSEAHTDMRGKERALAAVEGGDSVAELEQQRRTLLLDIESRALAYLRLRAGVIATETALRLFRERHRSAMMRRASETFSRVSGGEYSGLSAQSDKGQELLIANSAAGGSKLARDLSKGTRFQLYLALRIAGYHEIAAARESLPFIADDIMETFDDGRAARAFEQMADMARVGQVIYLTHHEHLCDIARTACPTVTIHRL
ncbi:AAA family ATPase [Ensifer sp.]|jgi:uncharacterized protein YhaN|uniref:AAA family ATPase n=1 Tax=Ensifer sp. TaxID=1872086 RepID=UPI002E0D9AC0|nr:AAA family ATPase [Ensifer sp.]